MQNLRGARVRQTSMLNPGHPMRYLTYKGLKPWRGAGPPPPQHLNTSSLHFRKWLQEGYHASRHDILTLCARRPLMHYENPLSPRPPWILRTSKSLPHESQFIHVTVRSCLGRVAFRQIPRSHGNVDLLELGHGVHNGCLLSLQPCPNFMWLQDFRSPPILHSLTFCIENPQNNIVLYLVSLLGFYYSLLSSL